MDPKATAKSKRVHSLHGRRAHATPSSISAKKKGPRPPGPPQLPSNWDRYDDDSSDGAVASDKAAPALESDEILVKSKGADYQYLIEQARSQSRSAAPAPLLPDEFAFDFLHGSSSMLSARGDALLSLCEDDNFVVDEYDGSSNYEVPFLSMDLNALARQLSKLKLSQRLFLEDDDLFGEEMLISEPKENIQQPERSTVTTETETVSSAHISLKKVQLITSPSVSPMESELDKLINSFEETNISIRSENITNAPSLDDALDELLAGSSLLVNNQTSDSVSKKDKTETCDNLIDELLEQAVIDVKKDKQVESSAEVISSSVPTKQVDDFDSWFDSL